MKRQPFTLSHRINNAISWYGTEYAFLRNSKNDYNEPTGEPETVEVLQGIYHSSQKSFIDLIGSEAASVKSKINKGILCKPSDGTLIKQDDYIIVNSLKYKVTSIDSIVYCGIEAAKDISLEEVLM